MEFRRVLLRSDLLAVRPVRIDDRRHFVVRADLQKVRLELVAGADIDRMHIVFASQLLQHDMDLMAVRRRPGIDLDGHAVYPTQEEGCRSERGCVGKECIRSVRYRWWPAQ